MSKITKEQYEFALARIEELLPIARLLCITLGITPAMLGC